MIGRYSTLLSHALTAGEDTQGTEDHVATLSGHRRRGLTNGEVARRPMRTEPEAKACCVPAHLKARRHNSGREPHLFKKG